MPNATMTRNLSLRVALGAAVVAASVTFAAAAAAETFSATASVKTAGGVSATAPVKIVVDRTMAEAEAKPLMAAYQSGGVAALRKALANVKPVGTVTVGDGKPTALRLGIERPTDKGRLLTLVSDTPVTYLGAGVPGARSTEGYDFAVIDIEVDAKGSGSGTFAPAAKIAAKGGAVIVTGYATEVVQLQKVTRVP
jgi:hypothetical protein